MSSEYAHLAPTKLPRRVVTSDALIAAAAESVHAAVLKRNVRDFALTRGRVESY